MYATEDNKKRTIKGLEQKLQRLSAILNREFASLPRSAPGLADPSPEAHHGHQMILVGRLEINYEPAGHLRDGGPRHDNDFADIQFISIPPTQNEMLCPIAPFLPANIPGAPHHRDIASMERLLDIQFRLLREELTYVYLSLAYNVFLIAHKTPSQGSAKNGATSNRFRSAQHDSR